MPLHDPSYFLEGNLHGGNPGSPQDHSNHFHRHNQQHPNYHHSHHQYGPTHSGQSGSQHENGRQDESTDFINCSRCLYDTNKSANSKVDAKGLETFVTRAFKGCALQQYQSPRALHKCLGEKLSSKLTAKTGVFGTGKVELCKENPSCEPFRTKSSMPVGILVSSIFVNRKNEYQNFL